MPIKLLLTQEGNIEINTLTQPGYSIDDEGTTLVLPFTTIDKGTHYIVIEPKGNLIGVIEYLIFELKKSNIDCILDHNLTTYWSSYCFEKNKIRKIGKTTKSQNSLKIEFGKIFKRDRMPLKHQSVAINHGLRVDNPANFSVPGSGKTQAALGCFIHWKLNRIVEKALVIGPTSCFDPWEDEIKLCIKKEMNIVRWSGSSTKRLQMTKRIKEADLILVTYQTACNDERILEQLMRRYKFLLILDESHNIKNPHGVRTQVMIRLSAFAYRRMILTGTPAPYSLTDLWSQFTFIWPSGQLLGNIYEFKYQVENTVNPLEKLKKDLKPFFIRTTKKQLGLPKIKNRIIAIKNNDIPIEQRKIIQLLELKTLHEARKYKVSNDDMDTLPLPRFCRQKEMCYF